MPNLLNIISIFQSLELINLICYKNILCFQIIYVKILEMKVNYREVFANFSEIIQIKIL